ncbi:hypothetical protein [uncultured Neglectibacter sp.]|uniref:hypothetical protein n=1 Tax=uncultured Neglectibacter sp. TaxID=1924108 RepID=UPI0034E05313
MKTMVRFSFLIVRKAIHLITLETEIFLPPQGAFLWETAAMGKQLVQKPPHILRVIIAQALKKGKRRKAACLPAPDFCYIFSYLP